MIAQKIHLPARLIFLSCFILLLQACGPPKPGIYKDDKIPSSISTKLHDLNTDLLAALKDDHPEHLENLISQEYIDKRAERVKLAALINIAVKKADYTLLSEYYISNQYVSGKDTIHERGAGINNHDLVVYVAEPEIYVAMFIPKHAKQ